MGRRNRLIGFIWLAMVAGFIVLIQGPSFAVISGVALALALGAITTLLLTHLTREKGIHRD